MAPTFAPPAPSGTLQRPPVGRLVAATLAVAVAAALVPTGTTVANVAGYVLGTFVTISLVGSFRREHERRRNSPWYSPIRGVDTVAWLLLLAGVVVALPHVWAFATAVSR